MVTITFVVAAATLAGLSFSQFTSQNPVNVTSVEYKGEAQTQNPSGIYRDLGYYGQIGNAGIQVYGDTFQCLAGANSNCVPMNANSAATTTSNPLQVNNVNGGHIFCDYLPSEKAAHPIADYGMGLTNVVQTGNNKGILFFVKDYRPNGNSQLQGSGVALIDTSGSQPTCTRTAEYWWPASSQPSWGDHGAIDGGDGYIYAYGGLQTAPSLQNGAQQPSDIYLARVPKSQATNQNAYQYWNGQSYQSGQIQPSPSNRGAHVFTAAIGSIIYSPYFQKFMYFTTAELDVFCLEVMTADKPEGPWSDRNSFFDATKVPANHGQTGAYAYAPVAQPQYDSSGQTLILTYTYNPNMQQVIKLNFAKGQPPCNPLNPSGCLPPLSSEPNSIA